jgi:hypothetical protein
MPESLSDEQIQRRLRLISRTTDQAARDEMYAELERNMERRIDEDAAVIRPGAGDGLRDPQDWTVKEFIAAFGAPEQDGPDTGSNPGGAS